MVGLSEDERLTPSEDFKTIIFNIVSHDLEESLNVLREKGLKILRKDLYTFHREHIEQEKRSMEQHRIIRAMQRDLKSKWSQASKKAFRLFRSAAFQIFNGDQEPNAAVLEMVLYFRFLLSFETFEEELRKIYNQWDIADILKGLIDEFTPTIMELVEKLVDEKVFEWCEDTSRQYIEKRRSEFLKDENITQEEHRDKWSHHYYMSEADAAIYGLVDESVIQSSSNAELSEHEDTGEEINTDDEIGEDPFELPEVE